MTISADTLFERLKLKAQVRRWKLLALLAIIALLVISLAKLDSQLAFLGGEFEGGLPTSSIARIRVNDLIMYDPLKEQALNRLKDNHHIKAVIMHVNSPGGTMTGSESLYHALLELSAKKPLVAVFDEVAASGGYFIALPAEYIIARHSTITGSIGVILQAAEVTEMAKKLGIEFLTFKTSPLKAAPLPTEKLTSEVKTAIDLTLNDSFNFFKNLVQKHRKLTQQELLAVSDGRIFTGNQAMKLKLIDAIGGEKEAIAWLREEKKLSADLPIRDVPLIIKKFDWREAIFESTGLATIRSHLPFMTPGLLTLWQVK